MRDKILFVIQRIGKDICGGAERECLELSQHMLKRFDVEIASSCARNNVPWDNAYPVGTEEIDGLLIRRFPVEEVGSRGDSLDTVTALQEDEKDLIRRIGPYCPSLHDYVLEHHEEYRCVIFVTYSVYTTLAGMLLDIPNKILLPTAHEEELIHLPMYRNDFYNASAFIYNTPEERDLVNRLFPGTETVPSSVTCFGMDDSIWNRPGREEVDSDYLLYLGRVCEGKNYSELNRFFIEYKKRHGSSLRLIVAGTIENGETLIWDDSIEYKGFISEEEKYDLIRGAKLLVMPSLYESLSIVLLESMALGLPVLVNGRCDVLKGQCLRSKAGRFYETYEEFESELQNMLGDEESYRTMQENGIAFVKERYNWNKVVEDIYEAIFFNHTGNI